MLFEVSRGLNKKGSRDKGVSLREEGSPEFRNRLGIGVERLCCPNEYKGCCLHAGDKKHWQLGLPDPTEIRLGVSIRVRARVRVTVRIGPGESSNEDRRYLFL